MPAFKNQHFVPRCLLRPFSLDEEGHALNLFNIRSGRFIQNAPLKGQSARHYMYGEDGRIERALGDIEGEFGRVYRVIADEKPLTPDDTSFLAFFTYLQFRRTEIAIQRLKHAYENMNEAVNEPAFAPPVPSVEELTKESLKLCYETWHLITDLKVRLIENRSKISFVTSDDPAALANRFLANKLNGRGYGLYSSGDLFVLPLSPRLCVLCYDGLVYTTPDLWKGRVIIANPKDADALNEIQYLRASENIYFSDWDAREQIGAAFESVRKDRRDNWATYRYFVAVEGQEGTFREASVEEGRTAAHSLIEQSFIYPTPSKWMSGLKFRSKPKTFYNGTAVGHVRKAEWLKNADGVG